MFLRIVLLIGISVTFTLVAQSKAHRREAEKVKMIMEWQDANLGGHERRHEEAYWRAIDRAIKIEDRERGKQVEWLLPR